MTPSTKQAAAPLARAQPMAKPKTPEEWSAFMRAVQSEHFLVGPVCEVGAEPEGFEYTVSWIKIEVGQESWKVGFTEKEGESHALNKAGIERLATAIGCIARAQRVDAPDPVTRTRHPRKCEYEAVAQMRLLDGSTHMRNASRAYDMTEDGADYITIFDQAAGKAYDFADKSLTEEQKGDVARNAGRVACMTALGSMHRQCETKACLRAMRACMGIRSKYRKADLENKMFVVVKLAMTGRTSDPVLRRDFARALFSNAIDATKALFGSAPQSAVRELPRPVEEPQPRALPHSDFDPGPDPDEITDTTTGEVVTSDPATRVIDVKPQGKSESVVDQASPPTASEASSEAPAGASVSPAAPKQDVIPHGRPGAGKTFQAATDDELKDYIEFAEGRMQSAKGGALWKGGLDGAAAVEGRRKIQAAKDELAFRSSVTEESGV